MVSDRKRIWTNAANYRGSDGEPVASLAVRILSVMSILTFLVATVYGQRRTPSAEAHYNQGLALLEKQTDRAITELKAAIALKPGFADAHNALGLALARKGELKLSAESFRTAIRLDPKLYTAHRNLGRSFNNSETSTARSRLSNGSASLQPDDADSHLLLGVALQRKQRVERIHCRLARSD